MKNIFIGFLLIFLNFRLTSGSVIINCIPNFIGYIFLLRGLRELEEGKYSSYFGKAIKIAKGLLVYEVLSFFADLFGVTTALYQNNSMIGLVIGIIATLITINCSLFVVKGIVEMKNRFQNPFEVDKLRTVWKYMATSQLAAYVFLLMFPLLSIVCNIMSLIFYIMFLVYLNRIKNDFEEQIRG